MLTKYFPLTKIFFFLSVFLLLSGNLLAQNCKCKVEITTNTENVLVYVDSIFVGKGNIKTELSLGDHQLLIKESTLNWNTAQVKDTLHIKECGKEYSFKYQLEKEAANFVQHVSIDPRDREKNGSFFNSTTFKILIGTAALLGGLSAYFKIQADKKYDDYLSSRTQSILDEVHRLDTTSGISFGLLQINFGYLLYKFLTD